MYCDKCGACCKLMNRLNLPDEYQYLDDGSGTCIYLKNNLCTIYERRPIICNHVAMYDIYFKQFMNWEDYETLLTEACIKIKNRLEV